MTLTHTSSMRQRGWQQYRHVLYGMIAIIGVSYEGITIDCSAPALQRKQPGMDLREVGRDTSLRLRQQQKAPWRYITVEIVRTTIEERKYKFYIIISPLLATLSMKVTLEGILTLLRPEERKAESPIEMTDLHTYIHQINIYITQQSAMLATTALIPSQGQYASQCEHTDNTCIHTQNFKKYYFHD